MKKTLISFILALSVSMVLQAQTFTIVNDLDVPKQHLPAHSGDTIIKAIVQEHQSTKNEIKCVANSLGQQPLTLTWKDPFFQTFVRAFAEHRPVILSPDMVWLNICQQFSHHVNQNAEKLREQLVYHEGKELIQVITEQDMLAPDADWNVVLDAFAEEIDKRTKGDIAKVMVSNFSTSGKCERTASQITLMGAMKQYSNYELIRIACGIPSITLEGTTADWERLLTKVEALAQYDLQKWVSDLQPILKEFINASKGEVNLRFWQSMVMTTTPEKLQNAGCTQGVKTTMLDGWFLKFFLYYLKGETPDKVPYNTQYMLPEIEKVPFIYKDLVRNRSCQMEMWAGFVGVEEDTTTFALRPKIGWMMVEAEPADPEIRALSEQKQPKLKVKEFPKLARKVGKLDWLTIEFTDGINIPKWIDEVQVKQLDLWGTFDEALLKRLHKLLPDRNISPLGDKLITISIE